PARAAHVRAARLAKQAGQGREVKRRAQVGPRQVNLDPPPQPGAGHGVAEPTARFAAEQGLEPASVEADRHDDQVVGATLALVAILDGDNDLLVAGFDGYRPPGERAVAARGVENCLGLLREHAAVGALEEL